MTCLPFLAVGALTPLASGGGGPADSIYDIASLLLKADTRAGSLTVADGTPGAGDAVSVLTDAGTLVQATGGNQPVLEDDEFPGVLSLKMTGTQHMTSTPASPIKTILMVIRVPTDTPTSRIIFARDGTGSTTKPAIEVGVIAS